MDKQLWTPDEVANLLILSGMAEDDILDLLKLIGDASGWTQQLNDVGLRILKRSVPNKWMQDRITKELRHE